MNDDPNELDDDSLTTLTKADIEARVQDWLDRLKALFQQVEDWALNHNWRADQSGSVLMHEELMQHFKLPAREQPILRLDRDDEYALFKPKGLWVIGANGRLDLFTSRGMFILVDTAEYGDDPQWEIFRATQSRHGDPFSPEIIARLV